MSEICRIIVAMSTELREQWEQLYLPLRPLLAPAGTTPEPSFTPTDSLP